MIYMWWCSDLRFKYLAFNDLACNFFHQSVFLLLLLFEFCCCCCCWCSTFTYLNHNIKKHKLMSNGNKICRKELKNKETPNEKKKNQTRRNQNETTISINTIYMLKLLLFSMVVTTEFSNATTTLPKWYMYTYIYIYIYNLFNSNQRVHCTGFTLFFFLSSSSPSSISLFSLLFIGLVLFICSSSTCLLRQISN